MSYIKLCQLAADDEAGLSYLEDCHGVVLKNTPSYPIIIQCEIIDWGTQIGFTKREAITSLIVVPVTVASAPPSISIRQEVYNQLVTSYPTLVI